MPDKVADACACACAEPIRVTVAYAATARDVKCVELTLARHATVRDALTQPVLAELCSASVRSGLAISVWGQRADLSRGLSSGDRIELCRPLLVDPKTARRERFARQGARAAGLFTGRSGR